MSHMSSYDLKLKEAALERSAVCLLVVKHIDSDGGRPVPHKLVPDFRKEELCNPYIEEMLRESSGRLLECLPEMYCSTTRCSAAVRDTETDVDHSASNGGIQPATYAANIVRLAPELLGTLTDCCYFILYLGDTPPPSTNPFDDDPDLYPSPSAISTSVPALGESVRTTKNGTCSAPIPSYMSLRARRRRVYGICRRAPPSISYSVLLLSATPCFDVLQHQFMSLTTAFFNRNFQDDTGDLRAFLLAISNPTTGILHRETASHYRDVPVLWLVKLLGIEHVLGLVKLLLLEGRILFHSSKPYKSSSAVLALLTLIPGLYTQALEDEEGPSRALRGYRWSKFGMPLRIFHEDKFVLQPLLVISKATSFFDKNPGFLVGTSNPLISALPSARLDAVVNLDTCQIDSQRFSALTAAGSVIDDASTSRSSAASTHTEPCSERGRESACVSPTSLMVDLARIAFEYGPADVDFLEQVMESLPTPDDREAVDEEGRASLSGESEGEGASVEWEGSDSWIRQSFQSYFERFLELAALALHEFMRDGAAATSMSSSWMRKAMTGLLQATPRSTCGFDVKLMDYNRAWVGQWTTTLNFRIWHDQYPHPCLPPDDPSPQNKHNSPTLLSLSSFPFSSAKESGAALRKDAPPAPGDGVVDYVYPNGDTYQGEMRGGQRQGKGSYVEHATGNTYEGDWVKDMRHGQGILTTGARDFLYDGDWVLDKRQGQGHCTIRGRATYSGGFAENKFHGQGKFVDSEGNVYEGGWARGLKEGMGTLRRAGGESYAGEWKGGQRHGLGTCQFGSSQYTGEWREGKRSGEGKMVVAVATGPEATSSEGQGGRETYEGQWLEDERHGWGVHTSADGDVREGEWYQDKLKDGECKVTYACGDQYLGECLDGRPHGHGTCKFVNGDVYMGGWEDGVRAGEGVCIYASGETYQGMWVADRPAVGECSSIPSIHEEEGGEDGLGRGKAVGNATATVDNPRRRLLVHAPTSSSKAVGPAPTPLAEIARMSGPDCWILYPGTGDTYEGSMLQGKRHGQGIYREKASGNRYEGSFRADHRHGHGVLVSGGKDFLYDGEWLDDRRTGRGHCTLKGKETYTGEWFEDAYHGKGKHVDAGGNTFEGEHVRGRREGLGTLLCTNGEVFIGEWKNGQKEGVGQCQYADGGCYSGEWYQDRWHGEGVFLAASGDKHEGSWSEGKRMGWGAWTSPTGDVIEGEWYQDEPKDGEWKITYSNGDQFVGACREGRPEGFGICKYANGAVYSGHWEEGLRAGQGKCVFANGEIYDGLWEKDRVSLRGLGTLSFQDGRVHNFS
ncbi:morn repeat containing protein [Nannochloropsis gaditana]|uniref:Morn repeat containing protein n=1 Tax=Nannochloropsis gaditana TaxID=72520 RepID=W7TJF1_9STRA|nr:morn repeat containing protein [Nannochloropsis gaditana]